MQENLVSQLEGLLQDLHNDFFSDPKSLIHRLETLLFDFPLSNSPDTLSKLTSLLLFDQKTNIFRYLLTKVSDKDRIAYGLRKNLLETIRKYFKTYYRSLSFQAVSLIKNCSLQLFQTDIAAPVKEASLNPLISILKLYEKDQIKTLMQPEKLIEILLKNIRDIKHSGGVKANIWHLLGLLCKSFPLELDTYKLEVSEICYAELLAQVESKSKPELVVIEGVLKGILQLLFENYLSGPQIAKLYSVLKVLITPIADVHNYKIIKCGLKVLSSHCSLFSTQIIKDSLSLLGLVVNLFQLTNRMIREHAGELLESLVKLLVSILDPAQPEHPALFKEILERILGLLDNPDLVLLSSGIRTLGHFSRSVRLFRSESKVRDLFTQMLDFADKKVLKPLNVMVNAGPSGIDGDATAVDSFKTILFLQKQVFSFLNAFSSLIQNLANLTESEAQSLFGISLLGMQLHRKFLMSYRVQLYDGLVNLFLNIFCQHHSLFIPWTRRLISKGLFETLKIPENVVLAGEDYHISLRETCELWHGIFTRNLIWTQACKSLFLSCFFQEIEEIIDKLELGYAVQRTEAYETIYIPNNQHHQQYLYRMVLFLDEMIRRLGFVKELEGTLLFWLPVLCTLAIKKLKKVPRTLALYKLLRVSQEVLEDLKAFEPNNLAQNPPLSETRDLIVAFYQELATNSKEYQEELLIDALKALLSIPNSLVFINNRLIPSFAAVLKQSFALQGPLALSLMALALDVLDKILTKNINFPARLPQIHELIKEVLPDLGASLFLETVSLKNLDHKLLFTLTLREILLELESFHEKTLDFLGKVSGLAHSIITQKKEDSSEGSLIHWDFENTLTFALPLTSRKLELNVQTILPRVLAIIKEAPSLQLQTTACEFLHSVMIYMVGKSANNPLNKTRQTIKKKSFAAIYNRLFPVLFSLAANAAHPCAKLLNALAFQVIRWIANTREVESPDLITLISCLMSSLAAKEDSGLREFAYQGLYELLKWTVKQRTKQELEQDPGIFKAVVKRVASFTANPDIWKRVAALSAIKALAISYKEDSFLVKKFAKETFRLGLKLAGGGGLQGEAKETLNFVLDKHQAYLIKSGSLKGDLDTLSEVYEGIFKPEALLRENCLRIFEDLIKAGVIKMAEEEARIADFIVSPLVFVEMKTVDERVLVKNYETFMGQVCFWCCMAKPGLLGLKMMEMKDFIRSAHNMKNFLTAFETNFDSNERVFLRKMQAFKGLAMFFSGLDDKVLQGLFRTAFQMDGFLNCLFLIFSMRNDASFRLEGLLEELMPVAMKLLRRFIDSKLLNQSAENIISGFILVLGLQSSEALADSILKGTFGVRKPEWWLKFIRNLSKLGQKRGFLSGFLQVMRNEAEAPGFQPSETAGLKVLLDFLLEFAEEEEIRTFVLEAFLRQNLIFQRFEAEFLRFLSYDFQAFKKSLDFMMDSLETLRFLVPILQLIVDEARKASFFEAVVVTLGKIEARDLQSNPEKLLAVLKVLTLIFGLGNYQFGKKEYFVELLGMSLKYPQNSLGVIIEGFNLVGVMIRNNAKFLEENPRVEDRLSLILAGIVSLALEIEHAKIEAAGSIQEMIEGDSKKNINEVQGRSMPMVGHEQQYEQAKSLGNAFLALIKMAQSFSFLRKNLFQLMRIEFLKKGAKETLSFFMNLQLPLLANHEKSRFLDELFQDFMDLSLEKVHPFVIDTLIQTLNSPDFGSDLLLNLAEKTVPSLLNILKDFKADFERKAFCFNLLEAYFEILSLDSIRENLHKRLYGLESSKNELTKSLIELGHQAKKTRYPPDIPRASLIVYTQAAYNCLVSVVKKTQTKESVFNQLLFAVSRDKNEELWVNLIDTNNKTLNFEVRTAFKEVETDRVKALSRQRMKSARQEQHSKSTRLLQQSFFTQTQSFLQESFLPEVLNEQKQPENNEFPGEKNAQLQLSKASLLEMDLINSIPIMQSLMKTIDFLSEKFPVAQDSKAQPAWMQSLYLEASRKELEPQILFFLIKIILNRPLLFQPFARYWYPILVSILAEKRGFGKGLHYYLRDVCLVLIDWHLSYNVPDLFPSASLGNKEKELLCRAVNSLLRVLADDNKEIFRNNLEIFEKLLEKWSPFVYLEKNTVLSMLVVSEEKGPMVPEKGSEKYGEKNEKPEKIKFLFKYLGASMLELGLVYKVPLLKDFQDFLSMGGIGGILSPQAYSAYSDNTLLRDLLRLLNHKKKIVGLAAVSAISRLFKEVYVLEHQDSCNKKREVFNKTMMDLYNLDKKLYSTLLKEVVQNFPDFLRNREIFGHSIDLLTIGSAKEKADALKAFRIYIHTHTDRNLIENDLKDLCLSLQGSVDKILMDNDQETHKELLNLLQLLATLLHLGSVKHLFDSCFARFGNKYLNKTEPLKEDFIEVAIRILESLKAFGGANENNTDPLLLEIKRSLLRSLSFENQWLKTKIFTYFEKEQGLSQAPNQRLLALIGELYDSEHEDLWLVSAMPLLLSLSKESSDYERLLFEEPLSESLKFYDFDFRNPDYLRQANRTQPLTPIFTLSLSQAPVFIHKDTENQIKDSQQNNMANNNPGGAFIRATVDNPNTYKDTIMASQLFAQRKQAAELPFSQSNRPVPFSQAQSHLFPPSNTQTKPTGTLVSGFLKPKARTWKNQKIGGNLKMGSFLAENMVDFTQTAFQGNRLRFGAENKSGARVTKAEDIRSRQAQLFEKRLEEARKHEITALRKYRIGELPDIEIKNRDIIDPLQGLCFRDAEIAGEVFSMVFAGLFREETNEEMKGRLMEGLMGFLRGSRSFNKQLMSSVHKILYDLSKTSRFLTNSDAKVIKETGLKGSSMFSSAVLLEETLVQIIEGGTFDEKRQNNKRRAFEGEKGIGFRENSEFWLGLLEIYRGLREDESIEGVMATILSRDYNEDELKSALDHKLRGNYRLALKYFEQKLVNPEKLFEEENNPQIKTQILDYLKTEQTFCYALLGKWETLSETLGKSTESLGVQTDFWLYSRVSESRFLETFDLLNQRFMEKPFERHIFEENFGYEVSLLSLFQPKPDLENSKHWLSQEKKAFITRFRNLGAFSNAARHEMIDKLQRVYEIKEYMHLLKQDSDSGFQKVLGSLITRWSSRSFALEANDASILAWYKTFLTRDICLTKLLNEEIRPLQAPDKKRLTELLLENQVKIAHFLIKLGLLDSGDAFLVKVLAKRPKDYFSWDLIKTIAKLKIHQANRSYSKDLGQLSLNFQQIATVLEKQRDRFRSQIDELVFEKFRVYIRKCHEGLLDVVCLVSDEESPQRQEVLLSTMKQIFFSGFREGKGMEMPPARPQGDLTREGRLILKETENLAQFCDKVLRLIGQNPTLEADLVKNGLKALVSENMSMIFLKSVLRCLSFGWKNEKLLLRMIVLVEKSPEKLGTLFKSAVLEGRIPVYLFLKWLPQMMHLLTNNKTQGCFEPIFRSLANEYPQAFIYPFHINHQRLFRDQEEDGVSGADFLSELKEILTRRFPSFKDFVQGLNALTHPEHRLAFHQTRIVSLIKEVEDGDSQITQALLKELQNLCKDLHMDVFWDEKDAMLGKYNEKFARNYKKAYLEVCGGPKFSDILKFTNKSLLGDFKAKLTKLFKSNNAAENLRKIGSGTEKLESFSRYLFLFTGEEAIEVPGQYSNLSNEPLPQYHVKITSFDQAILTLESLRRPKRIIMFGSDEKSYKFLVKGVEDLRLDQRIEQMFRVMNEAFAQDFGARNLDLRLKTFEVVPMSRSLGLLEWLENTSPIKELLEKELKSLEGEEADLKSQNKAFTMRMTWISGFNSKASAPENHKRLLYLDQKTIEDAFQEHEALIPKFLLRNALEKLSVSNEAFFLLKNRVIRNIAAVSIACYILGIGDRHLENFLINWRTGELIAIDFGYSFGAGVRLSLPEMLPFRFTRCLEALTMPVGIGGLLRKSMILYLKSLRKISAYLLEIAEAFIKDPLLDLTTINKEKNSKTETNGTEDINAETDLVGSEGKKLDIMRKKLMGISSWKIMLEELESSRHAKEGYRGIIWDAVQGGKVKSRSIFEGYLPLEVNDQVDCLLDHARDKNLLGRTWIGWTPYV